MIYRLFLTAALLSCPVILNGCATSGNSAEVAESFKINTTQKENKMNFKWEEDSNMWRRAYDADINIQQTNLVQISIRVKSRSHWAFFQDHVETQCAQITKAALALALGQADSKGLMLAANGTSDLSPQKLNPKLMSRFLLKFKDSSSLGHCH